MTGRRRSSPQRSVYEDSDDVRKEEIAALGGGHNVFSAYYDRLKVREGGGF